MTDLELGVATLRQLAGGEFGPSGGNPLFSPAWPLAVLDELDRLKARDVESDAAFDKLGAGMIQIASKMERELKARIVELESQVAVFFREAEALRAALAEEKAQVSKLKSFMSQAADNLNLFRDPRTVSSVIEHLRAFAEEEQAT